MSGMDPPRCRVNACLPPLKGRLGGASITFQPVTTLSTFIIYFHYVSFHLFQEQALPECAAS